MSQVIYLGKCSRCRQPARLAAARRDRQHQYVDCPRCNLQVILTVPAPPRAPDRLRCGDCGDILRYEQKRWRWICERCEAKG